MNTPDVVLLSQSQVNLKFQSNGATVQTGYYATYTFVSENGTWSAWTSWGSCNQTCGGGWQIRTRVCSDPCQRSLHICPVTDPSSQLQLCNPSPCPINGGWSTWSAWASCDVTCGGGSQNSTRNCTNPAPLYGGLACPSSSTQTQACNTANCPINGGWSAWSAWTTCNATCGGGIQTSTRNCSNPSPQYGGANCSGSLSQSQLCNTASCPINGSWSTWSAWNACNASCGGGRQNSTRTCTNPAPQFGGINCTGATSQSQSCNNASCPINGGWSGWSGWGACNATCGGGVQNKNRTCNTPTPAYGGLNCSGSSSQSQSCNPAACPVNGMWSVWSDWGPCNSTVGSGMMARTRNCSNPAPASGGNNCSGSSMGSQPCSCNPCPVDGEWSLWSAWDTCNVTCGGGGQTRARNCTNPPPSNGGIDCPSFDSSTEDQACNTNGCPVNGAWSSWSNWTACSVTCSVGNQTRTRTCTAPAPANAGLNCPVSDPTMELESCNTSVPCPVDGEWSLWSSWSACSVTCENGTKTRNRTCSDPAPAYGGDNCTDPDESFESDDCYETPCPVNGEWTSWSDWETCNVTCGGGIRIRSRNCTEPAHGGHDCPPADPSIENETCSTNGCPVDGSWSDWSAWSCSVTCGNGTQTRERSCTDPAPYNHGLDCPNTDPSNETADCDKGACEVNGEWSNWSAWDSCTATCGDATQGRTRTCTEPEPAYGGLNCSGSPNEQISCNLTLCAINGEWSDWSSWDPCSATCGNATQERMRTCTAPEPANGGLNCSGSPLEQMLYNLSACPIDGEWSDWSSWDPCSATCGNATQERTRTCTEPEPAYGGLNCSGSWNDQTSCNVPSCAINGMWSSWSDWDSCSVLCGGGTETRSRSCTNPVPQDGGDDCPIADAASEQQPCNTRACLACRQLPAIAGTTIDVSLSADVQEILLVVICIGNAVFEDGSIYMTVSCNNGVWVPPPRSLQCSTRTSMITVPVTLSTQTSAVTTSKSRTGPRKPPQNGTLPDPCISGPCCNNATCVSYKGAYQCQCLPNTAGFRCDIFVIGSCDPEKCGEGSSGCYVRPDGTMFCDCMPGFDGDECDNNINECASSPCLNNGTCHDAVNEFQCTCKRGWIGPQCTYDRDECLSNPCRMNGTCYEPDAGDYNCDCVPGFTGKSCEVNVNDCNGTTCKNGGHCADGVQSHRCECPKEYSGSLCEIKSKALLTIEQIALGTAIIAFIVLGSTYGFAAFLDLSKLCYNHELVAAKRRVLENQKEKAKKRRARYEKSDDEEEEEEEDSEEDPPPENQAPAAFRFVYLP